MYAEHMAEPYKFHRLFFPISIGYRHKYFKIFTGIILFSDIIYDAKQKESVMIDFLSWPWCSLYCHASCNDDFLHINHLSRLSYIALLLNLISSAA